MEYKPSDFGVPIYLNQRVVFDLLAMMEDGLSEFRDETSSTAESRTRSHGVEGEVSSNNLLKFIGLAFKGGGRRETGRDDTSAGEVVQRKTHTPASLFYKLRARLDDGEDSLIKRIESHGDLEALRSGEFVEFRALLRKNPLVELLEMFRTWMGISLQLQALESGEMEQAEAQQLEDQMTQALLGGLTGNPSSTNTAQQQTLSPEQQLAEQNPVYRTIKLFENALTEHGSLEIVGELLDVPNATAVLSTRLEYFEGGDAAEIIDGEYRILGKVVRVVPDGDGSINLLRKTPFGAIKESELEELANLLTKREEGQDEIPIELPEIRTRIEAPTILILPMAVFV